MKNLDQTWSAAGLLVLAGLCVCTGCVPALTSRYEATESAAVGIGEGQKIRLEVIDTRSAKKKKRLGTTDDVYHQPITWDRPAEEVVEDAFQQALSRAGYFLNDDARVTYRVGIHDVTVSAGWGFDSDVHAAISFDIEIINDQIRLGRKRIGDSKSMRNIAIGKGPRAKTMACLSLVLSRAVDNAVGDQDLIALLTAHRRSR